MKIACYCRCAYNDGKSLHLQEEYMKSVLQEVGVSEQDVVFYAEYGSGINAKREELRRLLCDVKSENIKTVYVRDIARLSRDIVLLDKILHYLETHNVTLISIQEPKFSEDRQSGFLSIVKNCFSAAGVV